jgi:diaminopimelate epimerase
MHGLGNDFMVIDGINQNVDLKPEQIKSWSNRHLGVGFDQLLLVERAESRQALFKYRIFNADGGEVDQCGNGARCFARFVREKGLTDARIIPVETNAGLLQLKMIDDVKVEVDMGAPQFEPSVIPFAADQRQSTYQLEVNGLQLQFSALSMGNPHAVLLVDDIEKAPVHELGPILESHTAFPQHVNVGFMQILERDHFRLRVFERGVGETQACGSGACAAMVAGCQLGLLNENVTASLIGGDLKLYWNGEGEPVMMTGDTAMVFEGEIRL